MVKQEWKTISQFSEIAPKIQISSFQRSIVSEHVVGILEYLFKIKEGEEPLLGAIEIGNLHDRYFIIDGQHRLEALRIVDKKLPFRVLFYNCDHIDEIIEIFMIRNKNLPIPEFIKECHGKKTLLEKIETTFKTREGFSYIHTNRPYVPTKDFMDHLAKSSYILEIESVDEFSQQFDKINAMLKVEYENEGLRKQLKISSKMYENAQKWNNYFGLDRNRNYFSEKGKKPKSK